MTRIILIRHGETDWNAERRIQGSTDVPLNGTGEAQARCAADRLAAVKLDAIYTSDFQRAEKTARVIAESHPTAEFVVTPMLRERSWGELEGLTWEQIEKDHAEVARNVVEGDPAFAPPGGESKNTVLERAEAVLSEIETRFPGGTVLITAHGGITVVIIKTALGIDLATRTPFRVENCAIHIIDSENGRRYVQTLNDMCHIHNCRLP